MGVSKCAKLWMARRNYEDVMEAYEVCGSTRLLCVPIPASRFDTGFRNKGYAGGPEASVTAATVSKPQGVLSLGLPNATQTDKRWVQRNIRCRCGDAVSFVLLHQEEHAMLWLT